MAAVYMAYFSLQRLPSMTQSQQLSTHRSHNEWPDYGRKIGLRRRPA